MTGFIRGEYEKDKGHDDFDFEIEFQFEYNPNLSSEKVLELAKEKIVSYMETLGLPVGDIDIGADSDFGVANEKVDGIKIREMYGYIRGRLNFDFSCKLDILNKLENAKSIKGDIDEFWDIVF